MSSQKIETIVHVGRACGDHLIACQGLATVWVSAIHLYSQRTSFVTGRNLAKDQAHIGRGCCMIFIITTGCTLGAQVGTIPLKKDGTKRTRKNTQGHQNRAGRQNGKLSTSWHFTAFWLSPLCHFCTLPWKPAVWFCVTMNHVWLTLSLKLRNSPPKKGGKKLHQFSYPPILSRLLFRCRSVLPCQFMCCRISLSAAMSVSVISHQLLFPFILFMSLTAAAFDDGFRKLPSLD